MKIWQILNEDKEWEIEVGPITVLKGNSSSWYQLIRLVDDFFNNKSSTVTIFEDTQSLIKKDWECLFIPFDAHVQLDKITAKSPLRMLLEEACQDISLTPVFQEFEELWEELYEELQFINNKFEKFGLGIHLEPFSQKDLESKLFFSPLISSRMAPIEFKQLLLNLFTERTVEKKRLILIEMPELYADRYEIENFLNTVNHYACKGTIFIIVTQNVMKGNQNIYHNKVILNEARIDLLKGKVTNQLPFACNNAVFEKAKMSLLEAVDNSRNMLGIEVNPQEEDEAISVILFILARELNIPLSIDTTGLSPNLRNFIDAC